MSYTVQFINCIIAQRSKRFIMGQSSGKLKAKSTSANLLVVGLEGSGKSSVLNRLANGDDKTFAQQLTPTKGTSIIRLSRGGFVFNCYDLGGSEAEASTWDKKYSNMNGIIFVIDSSDRYHLEKCGVVIRNVLASSKLKGIPLLILANKQDILEAMSSREITDALNCAQIKGRQWQVTQTSAVTGQGLKVAMSWISYALAQNSLKYHEKRKARLGIVRS